MITDSTTSVDKDHIQKTENQHREPQTVNMEIISVENLSPTVKHLVLLTTEKPIPISFKAGQWVDMFIPGVDTVGGYTICSSPFHLSRTGELSLCVKESNHPPASWVHNVCQPGRTVSIRIGGDFFFDTDDHKMAGKNILLIGGGVGINPLASIVTQLQDYRKNVGSISLKSCLMFSAKTEAELLFMDSFNKFALEDETFTVQYFITSEDEHLKLKDYNSQQDIGRITKAHVESCLRNDLNVQIGLEEAYNETLVYVCGPPPMIEDVQGICKSLGIEHLFFEKWW